MVTFFINTFFVWWFAITVAACIKTLLVRGITVLHIDHRYLSSKKVPTTIDARFFAWQ